ncbi:MAG TPA: IS110 family transposase [Mycobacterium sp.]|uniref:IS110 family transposase n=1 Tax=Phycicoccus TaxID=367298 RepID=UPI001D424740|nr:MULTISPECIES: IS110 family transposase [Phycicoccus]MCB0905212.1 IS110 family transposase [Actinomycetota bacterium]MCB1013180.1 IS110 family transposase [Microthrixaceae bacterium]MCB9405526.1 IS110 family transposase [Tetrasphaera sp.]HOT58005.1 IS110 family transposase [Ornithinibacter sp.]HRD14377.1 IS110 family transposase [Mycobacterium sp.]
MSIDTTDLSSDPVADRVVRVQVGIDAAVVANHQVTIRETTRDGQVQLSRFHASPTIAGLTRLSERLAAHPHVMAVAEPTSMTWLGLHVALQEAGCDLALVGTRHAARLRGAISGKNKSDVIDADVLAMAGDVFTLSPLRPPAPPQLALRRAVVRRGKLVIDGNRSRRRLISLARWAFPDVWQEFAGSWPTAVAVLTRWPDLTALASARRSSVTNVVAAHTRGVPDVDARAERIRAAAARTTAFWDGHLDLEALAWETSEHLRDIALAAEQIERATDQAHHYWAALYGDDPLLLSVPGMGPMTAPTIRAFFADASAFPTAKAAAAYVGLTPSTWSSGTVVQPSRAITKEGPAVLRLACYQAAGGARRVDPQLAEYYRHLMVERGHCHTQATVAVARKLVERTWTVLTRGQPFEYRDLDGTPLTRAAAKDAARALAVPKTVRARARARSAATHRSKLTK